MAQLARRVIECFIFIQDLLCSYITPNNRVDLVPDDILIDILSRLPAHCVLQCHKVCRHWRALTSTRRFAEMQFRRATPMLFVQCEHPIDNDDQFHLLDFDEKAKRFRKVSLKLKVLAFLTKHNYEVVSSYGGLVVCQAYSYNPGCVVFDPFTNLYKRIHLPFKFGMVCGLFFQPLADEYKILVSSDDYYVFYSKSLLWRNITSGSFTFRPYFRSPVILNHALHWIGDPNYANEEGLDLCMHAVIVFDMESEKLRTMPHPNITHDHEVDHIKLYIFEKDESLYLCNMLGISEGHMEMWVLEDYENWIWVKRYKLSVKMLPKLDPWKNMEYFDRRKTNYISISSINKNELLIDWFSYGLYILDVIGMTLTELEDPCYVRDIDDGEKRDCRKLLFISHKSCLHPCAR